MKSLSREESANLVEKVLTHDEDAGELFYEHFKRVVYDYAIQWTPTIKPASYGLYGFEDVCSELWFYIIKKLHTYDAKRSSLTTWFYMLCESECGMLYRNMLNKKNHAEEGTELISLNNFVLDKSDKEIEYMNLIIDPKSAFENNIVSDDMVYQYIYAIKNFVEKMNPTQRLVYVHFIKGVNQTTSANIIGITQSYISRIRRKLIHKARILWNKVQDKPISPDANMFIMELLSTESDDDISEKYNYELAVVKICREMLAMADLYSNTKVAI
jgi:RNA polymerase sigma factor (sigma-70 family)